MSNGEVSLRITSLGDNFYRPADIYLSTSWLLGMARGRGTLGLGFGDEAQT